MANHGGWLNMLENWGIWRLMEENMMVNDWEYMVVSNRKYVGEEQLAILTRLDIGPQQRVEIDNDSLVSENEEIMVMLKNGWSTMVNDGC